MSKVSVENWKYGGLLSALNRFSGSGGRKLSAAAILGSIPKLERDALIAWDPRLAHRLEIVTDEFESKGLAPLGRRILTANLRRGVSQSAGVALGISRTPSVPRAPWVVLGFQRSGTTFLQQLLSQSPEVQGVPFWKMLSPDPRLPRWRKMLDAGIAVRLNRWVNPESLAIHEIRARSFEECWWLFGHQTGTLCFDFHFDMPRTKAFLAEPAEREGLYRRYREMLAFLAEPNDDRPFVLKAPDHLWRLDELFRVFPDARVIWMHRDPRASVASFSALSALNRRSLYGEVDPRAIGPHVMRTFHEGVSSALEFRARRKDVRIFDLYYSDLVADPIAAVRKIHEFFGTETSPGANNAYGRYLARDTHGKRGAHAYDLSTYGLSGEEVEARFSDYARAFPGVRARDVRAKSP